MNKEKRAKLADALAPRQGASGATGASAAAPLPTLSTPIVATPLVVA